jgi:predicted DsbA family dithiol-disulfide isomerase
VDVKWIAYPLHPDTPEEGLELERLFAGRGIDIPATLRRLACVAAECGLPFSSKTMTFNTRKAQEVGKWAESLGMGDKFDMAVFKAYFVDGLNIAKTAVLVALAESVGLRGAEDVLSKGSFKEAVDQDWSYSRQCEIVAVPTFMVEGRRVVGAQPYEALENLVKGLSL